MKNWIRGLRVGAIFCLLPALFMLGISFQSDISGLYEVKRKYKNNDKFRISAVGLSALGLGEIDAPCSKRFYEKTQAGDTIYFGFHHITLRRDGKLVATEIPVKAYMALAWILLALFPLTAFVPEERMPIKRTLLTLLTVAEGTTLVTFLISTFFTA